MCVQNRLFHEIIHLLYEDKNSFRNFVLVKFTDLKDLRVIKKSLEPQSEPKTQQNQPRKRSVVLKSREEEHARNEGLVIGQKVRMMESNDTATITGFGKDYYELELDGLTIRAAALRKELDEVFALSCTYTYSTPGITNVTIR